MTNLLNLFVQEICSVFVRERIGYPAFMRTCISCGDPIPQDKRKDARYCGKSKCRGREYRKRHPKPVSVDGCHQPQTSTVLACPCGRRYLLSVTELHEHEAESAAKAPPESVTQTDIQTEKIGAAPHPEAEQAITQTAPQTASQCIPPAETPDRQSEHLPQADTQTVSATVARSTGEDILQAERVLATCDQHHLGASVKAAVSVPAQETVTEQRNTRTQVDTPPLTTLEFRFCDASGRPVSFRDAVTRERSERWSLNAGVRLAFRFGDSDPRNLGGTPGRWPRYYGHRSPSLFGFDDDLVVMYWDQRERRGRAASANGLRDILGENWKAVLRELRDKRLCGVVGWHTSG